MTGAALVCNVAPWSVNGAFADRFLEDVCGIGSHRLVDVCRPGHYTQSCSSLCHCFQRSIWLQVGARSFALSVQRTE